MNPVLGSLMVGRSLSEGDYLGALPYIPDLLKAIKSAAPNLLREAAAKQLEKVQRKLSPTGTLPVVQNVAAPAVVDTTAAPVSSGLPKWVLPAAITVGGLILIYVVRQRANRR